MPIALPAFIGLVMQIVTPVPPPQILQIVREPLKPGVEAAYQAIEEETAGFSAALGCPHPYLAAESLTGPKEVWWFNGYESSADQKQVYDAYTRNAPLMAALQRSSEKKASLTLAPIEVFANLRRDLSAGTPWVVGRGRFLVITVTKSNPRVPAGTVFESADGTRFIVTAVRTREEAGALAGPESRVLAVRPSWSFPAPEWIAADPGFWQPASKGK